MSRAALLCCTALTLSLGAGVAHAQQGNLPRPVQKPPAYPPVVCVTPNWRPEPCEGRHDIPQVMEEEDRAPPALPLLNSRNTPRAFECIKPAEPGWLGLGGLFQLLDCTWFGWIKPYPVKPFDGKWPASQSTIIPDAKPAPAKKKPGELLGIAPPAEYDHPYTGKLTIVHVPSQDEVRMLCHGATWDPRIGALSCTYHNTALGKCVIVVAPQAEFDNIGLKMDASMRHELAHCNGWPNDHPGIH